MDPIRILVESLYGVATYRHLLNSPVSPHLRLCPPESSSKQLVIANFTHTPTNLYCVVYTCFGYLYHVILGII